MLQFLQIFLTVIILSVIVIFLVAVACTVIKKNSKECLKKREKYFRYLESENISGNASEYLEDDEEYLEDDNEELEDDEEYPEDDNEELEDDENSNEIFEDIF